MNGSTLTIIGVAPENFFGTFVGYAIQFWVPMSMQEGFEPGGYKLGRSLAALAGSKASRVPEARGRCGASERGAAGYGRTGTVLGCYLVSEGLEVETAIETLIGVRPCSREVLTVPDQIKAIVRFHERRKDSKASTPSNNGRRQIG